MDLADSLGDLLHDGRDPLAGTIDELGRTAKVLDDNSDTLDSVVTPAAPTRTPGSSGWAPTASFFNFYLCAVQVKVTGPDGKPLFSSPSIDSNLRDRPMPRKVMIRFSERDPVRIGLVGTALLVVLTVLSVNLGNLPLVSAGTEYNRPVRRGRWGSRRATTSRSAGSRSARCGPVELDQSQVAVRFRVTNRAVRLADLTTAEIKTAHGAGHPQPAAHLARGPGVSSPPARSSRRPAPPPRTSSRTSSARSPRRCTTWTPVSWPPSLDTLAETLHTVAPDVPAALDGVTRLSGTLNRPATGRASPRLLRHAEGVHRRARPAQRPDHPASWTTGSALLDEVQQRRAGWSTRSS